MSFDKAPNYEARLKAQKDFEAQMLSGNQEHNWIHPTGSYGDASLVEGYKSRKFVNRNGRDIYLSGLEVFLHDLTGKLLDSKPKGEPVILIDIGGGAGLSWSRLAQVFEREVRESRLAFVVTNLLLERADVLRKYGSEAGPLSESLNLVSYISGEFGSLRGKSIVLPNDRKITLEKNVDLAHDRKAPTAWSKVPERDVSGIGHLISRWGMYLVSNTDLKTLQAVASPEEERDRIEGIRLAHRHLESAFALQRVVTAEAGQAKGKQLTYTIFKTSDSPLINLNLS